MKALIDSNRPECLLASRSNGRRLVLVTVVWFWRRSSTGCRSSVSLSKEDVRKERWVKNKVGYIGGILGRGTCRGYGYVYNQFPPVASTATRY